MPFLKLNTNSAIDTELKSKLLGELSQLVSKETGKPERYVMISIEQNDAMLFAGSTTSLAYLECKSIGLSSSQARNLSAAICQLLNARLSIPQDRIYIEFSNCPADFWGWNGSTFG